MARDRDREYRRDDPYEDRNRARERPRHSRDDQDYSSRRRSRSRDRYPSPHRRVKREDERSPPRRRDYSPRDRPHSRQRSLSPYSKREQRSRREGSPRRQSSIKRSQSPEAWGSHQHDVARDRSNPRSKSPTKPKEKPNYGLSGLLAAATNLKNGIVLKYQEPPEAKKTKGWIVYIYKDEKQIDTLRLDSQSSFLVGRDELVHPCNFESDNRWLIFLSCTLHVQSNMP
jgi:smad nuclear-interacting protein 1